MAVLPAATAHTHTLNTSAIVDSVEENVQASRRLLLLYNASTFLSKRHTSSISNNNNNISKSDGDGESSTSFDGSEEVYPDTRQQLECVTAMHRALVEGSLKVRIMNIHSCIKSGHTLWFNPGMRVTSRQLFLANRLS